jgi:nucleotide-binding universal stress UspA family protein
LKERQRQYLAHIERLYPEPARVRCAVEVARAEELILARAQTEPGTLIVMATHGHSGLKRWLLGSIAEKVLQGATTPLLLIRASEEGGKNEGVSLHTLIVPLDGSSLAERALPYAVELARTLGLELTLVRAFSLPTPIPLAEDQAETVQAVREQIGHEARAYLAEKAEQVRRQGVQVRRQGVQEITTVADEGPAAESILTVARDKPHSWVVMCTHGRSGVRRWVLGSVTERVTRHVTTPVLIISDPQRFGEARGRGMREEQ